jgi:hypothetical protein
VAAEVERGELTDLLAGAFGGDDALLSWQSAILAEPDAIETLAQRYAARLIAMTWGNFVRAIG